MKRYRALYLPILALIFITLFIPISKSVEQINYTGTVVDNEIGSPLEDVEVSVQYQRYWRRYTSRWEPFQTLKTDKLGQFSIKLDSNENYRIIICHFGENKEIDYVPFGEYIRTSKDENITVSLIRAASIKINGQAYFIETSGIPSNTYKVLNSSSESTIKSGSLSLMYGTHSESFSELLNIPREIVIVPGNTGVLIEIISNIKLGEKTTQRKLTIYDFQEGISPGNRSEIDLRSKVLPTSFQNIKNETNSLRRLINEKEQEGFYLAVERQRLGEIDKLIQEAENLNEIESYELSFTKLREAYILYRNLSGLISGMVNDATRSTYMLIVFITISSFILGSLFHESAFYKIFFSAIFNIILLISLWLLHPGVKLVSLSNFYRFSILSFVAITGIWLFLPRLMSISGGEDASIVNMIIPIMSIAKRSLRRRWIRFGLTIFSVLILVGSFISLTSFTTGYGLDVKKTSTNLNNKMGVLIRAPNPPPEKATAPFSGGVGAAGAVPLDDNLPVWLEEDINPTLISPKYSTQPLRQYREAYNPIGKFASVHIFGVLGIVPSVESSLTDFNSILLEGNYLADEGINEVLVSKNLLSKIQGNLGDKVSMECFDTELNVTIVGVLDDDAFSKLKDLDGDPMIPQKIIELMRIEMDGPDYVVEGLAYCEPEEVIVVNHLTVENLGGIWINRIALSLSPEINLVEFAQRIAINRGFRVWASTETGVYLCQLAGYFEGKGLPVIIPWVIVMLNVVITMLNSYYERSSEIMVYSSIGMNPRQISSIFLAETGVIGIIGGSLGYILGLSAYKFIYLVTPSLQVQQKVSSTWSLAAIGISLTAVLVGGIVALLNSTSITPSLTRRWRASKVEKNTDPFIITLPVKVFEEELDEYVSFVDEQLRKASHGYNFSTKMIKKRKEDDRIVFDFVYRNTGTSISTVYAKNVLYIEKNKDEVYSTTLECLGDENGAQAVGSLMRKIGIEWSLSRSGRVKTSIIQHSGDIVK